MTGKPKVRQYPQLTASVPAVTSCRSSFSFSGLSSSGVSGSDRRSITRLMLMVRMDGAGPVEGWEGTRRVRCGIEVTDRLVSHDFGRREFQSDRAIRGIADVAREGGVE